MNGRLVTVFGVCVLASCTSPLDVNTPRVRIVATPVVHAALPESLRVHPIGVQVTATESDVSGPWVNVSDTLVTVSIDTSFLPPLHWLGGVLYAKVPAMNRAPTIRVVNLHCDSVAAGTSRILTGDDVRVLASRRVGTITTFDSLTADSLSAILFSKYDPGKREIIDSLLIGVRNGLYGDAAVSFTAVLRIKY